MLIQKIKDDLVIVTQFKVAKDIEGKDVTILDEDNRKEFSQTRIDAERVWIIAAYQKTALLDAVQIEMNKPDPNPDTEE